MKLLLSGLGLWSAGCGFYFGILADNQIATRLGFGMAFLLLFVTSILAIAELPRFIRKRNKRK
jgi:hypothetical protein